MLSNLFFFLFGRWRDGEVEELIVIEGDIIFSSVV